MGLLFEVSCQWFLPMMLFVAARRAGQFFAGITWASQPPSFRSLVILLAANECVTAQN